jgi:xanthine dehydrogenase YagR molybdenum-binding subunit
MKFTTPATTNSIDRLKVIGKPVDRIDGPLKTTGTAPYAYERPHLCESRTLSRAACTT